MRIILCFLQVSLLLVTCCASAALQEPKTAPPQKPEQATAAEPQTKEPPHELTVADATAWLDGFMPMQLEREDIAGAVVLVVKDGKVLLAKGYGYKDVAKKIPVTPDSTLFRPGSISKLFTWTAVMQLVEQGKLDLDRDVNDYIDFKIPATYPQPITLRHIMTHTAGFEESVKDLIMPEGTPMAPIGSYLAQHIPKRIFAPGTVPAYSNYAATLAGYIVERVSGKPFNDYVTENIFRPLGMTRSTFAQPLPPELKPLMSNGYKLGSGAPKGFEILEPAPAGSLSATATDLSRFMIAHLQDGKFESGQILRPETARLMHSRKFGLNPALNGMCLGFYEESRNGHRIFGHGGDTIYFHSDLHLMPDAGLGFFVSYNSRGKAEISPRSAVWKHFLDRYFPFTPPDVPKLATADADARTISGHYITTRREESSFIKLLTLFGQTTVALDKDGDITVDPFKDYNGQPKRWHEIAPLLYRAVNGQEMLAFQKDASGRMQIVLDFPAIAEQKASLAQNSRWNFTILISSLVVMGLTVIFWPIMAVVRRHFGRKLELTPRQRSIRFRVRIVCLINLLFMLGLLFVIATADDLSLLSGKLDSSIHFLQALGLVGAAGSLLVVFAGLRWSNSGFGFWVKLWNFLIALSCIGLFWFAIYWNLLNFSMHY
jgi:CubicO group peptidase (beta-lactamase class C family)